MIDIKTVGQASHLSKWGYDASDVRMQNKKVTIHCAPTLEF